MSVWVLHEPIAPIVAISKYAGGGGAFHLKVSTIVLKEAVPCL
jgi:hypothetical protein